MTILEDLIEKGDLKIIDCVNDECLDAFTCNVVERRRPDFGKCIIYDGYDPNPECDAEYIYNIINNKQTTTIFQVTYYHATDISYILLNKLQNGEEWYHISNFDVTVDCKTCDGGTSGSVNCVKYTSFDELLCGEDIEFKSGKAETIDEWLVKSALKN